MVGIAAVVVDVVAGITGLTASVLSLFALFSSAFFTGSGGGFNVTGL